MTLRIRNNQMSLRELLRVMGG